MEHKENTQKIKIITSQKGFSLIEILIALTLMGIALTFVGGKVLESLEEGRIQSARIQMKNFEAILKDYKRKCGSYPTSDQGLDALISKPTGGRECKDYPASGFMEQESVPKDPWDVDYVYESDGKTFNIISLGADKEQGGEGNDADVYLKEDKSKKSAEGEASPEAGGATE